MIASASMPSKTKPYVFAALMALVIAGDGAAATRGAWEEDMRRCMIYKPIEGGRVVIANDEGVLEIDVQTESNTNDPNKPDKYSISFDGGPPIDATPPKDASGIYDNRLGSYKGIAPVFAKAHGMTIAIAAADSPARTVMVPIGDGAKAMAFLKKCEDYWRRQNAKHR